MASEEIREDVIFIYSPPYHSIDGFLKKVERWLLVHRCGHLERTTSRSVGRQISHVFIRSDVAQAALSAFRELAAQENHAEWFWDYLREIVHIPMKRAVPMHRKHLY